MSKSDQRINAYGTVDELNASIGLVADQDVNIARRKLLREIQNNLFIIGSLLAAEPGKTINYLPELREGDVTVLESEMDSMNELLPEMKNFILPGGHQSVSFCHVARCVCRRAEREVIALAGFEKIPEIVIVFLNRLSDYLFVLARMMGKELEVEEIKWRGKS